MMIKLKNICLGFLALSLLFSCKNNEEAAQDNNKVAVKVHEARKEEFKIPMHASGLLFSKSEIKLAFKTGGIVKSIFVDEGTFVNKDQTLAQLNLSEIQAQVDQARLNLEKSRRDYLRIEKLYKDSVATLEQYENMKTMLEMSKAKLEVAEFNLRYSSIKAPSNGTILKKMVEKDEIISPGYPVFLFANNESTWVLRTAITDKDIVKLKVNDSAEVFFDAYPDKTFMAHVSEIGNMADPFTGTFEVELSLEKTDLRLVSGFFGKALIFPENTVDVFKIPISAMIDGNEHKATIVRVENNKAVKTEVNILKLYKDFILVKDGLNEKDLIIIEGADYVEPDSELEIIENS